MSSGSIRHKHGIAEDSRSLAQLEAAVVRVASRGPAARRLPTDLLADDRPDHRLRGPRPPGRGVGFAAPTSLFVAAEATRRTVELDVVCARAVLAGCGCARRGALPVDQPLAADTRVGRLQRPGDPRARTPPRRRRRRSSSSSSPNARASTTCSGSSRRSRRCAGTRSAWRSTTSAPATPACAC